MTTTRPGPATLSSGSVRPARGRRTPRGAGVPGGTAALILAWSVVGICHAAVSDFHYSLHGGELYSQDVFREGDNARDDFITTFGFGADWSLTTLRSTTALQYSPAYFAYSKFSRLDQLDHHVQTNWKFEPGRRSLVGFRQGYSYSDRQVGFYEFPGVPGDQANPIVPRTRRVVWDATPFYSVDVSRRWTLETEGTYISQRFSSSNLVDSTQVGLQVAFTAKAGREHRIGGRVRGDSFNFEPGSSSQNAGVRDNRFLNAEFIWSREREVFKWSAAAGVYRASGAGTSSQERPTLRLDTTWRYRVSRLLLGYALGYSSSGGFGGSTRSQVANVAITRHSREAFDATLRGSYLKREPLDRASSSQGEIEGGSLALETRYHWRSGLGVRFLLDAVRQNRTDASRLDYREASLAIVYSPPVRNKTVDPQSPSFGSRVLLPGDEEPGA